MPLNSRRQVSAKKPASAAAARRSAKAGCKSVSLRLINASNRARTPAGHLDTHNQAGSRSRLRVADAPNNRAATPNGQHPSPSSRQPTRRRQMAAGRWRYRFRTHPEVVPPAVRWLPRLHPGFQPPLVPAAAGVVRKRFSFSPRNRPSKTRLRPPATLVLTIS